MYLPSFQLTIGSPRWLFAHILLMRIMCVCDARCDVHSISMELFEADKMKQQLKKTNVECLRKIQWSTVFGLAVARSALREPFVCQNGRQPKIRSQFKRKRSTRYVGLCSVQRNEKKEEERNSSVGFSTF